ncbi:MAG TPA: hypothetical protein VGJ18_00985 [Gemmatimonadaceae bacterium]
MSAALLRSTAMACASIGSVESPAEMRRTMVFGRSCGPPPPDGGCTSAAEGRWYDGK